MASFKVYLADPLGCVSADLKLKINTQLQTWFKQCAGASGQAFDDAVVSWLASTPSLQPHELLLFFVPDRSKSIATELGKSPGDDSNGFTAWVSGATGAAVSEVYVSAVRANGARAAALGFHELMHNKLRLNDAMHAKGGLAADSVDEATQLSKTNVSDMGAALKNTTLQYMKGYESAATGRNDPLSRYYTI